MLVTKKPIAKIAVNLYKKECAPLAPKTEPAAPEPNAAPASAPLPCCIKISPTSPTVSYTHLTLPTNREV